MGFTVRGCVVALLIAIAPPHFLTITHAQAPAAPTNLQTSQVTGDEVHLSWVAPSGIEPGAHYRVEAGSGHGLANLAVLDVFDTPSYVATNVPAGRYYVRVKAVVNGLASEPSNEIVVDVAGCAGPPAPPGAFQWQTAGQSVFITFPEDATGCGGDMHIVEAGSAPGLSDLAVAAVPGQAAAFHAVPYGTYFVRLRAQNARGTSGPSPEAMIGVAQPGCRPPLEVQNLTAAVVGNSATFQWSFAGGLDRSFPSGLLLEAGSVPGAANLAALQMPAYGPVSVFGPAGTYWTRLRAYTPCGTTVSADVPVTLTAQCALPGRPVAPDVSVGAGASMLAFTWQEGGHPLATSYRVDVGSAPGLSDVRRVEQASQFPLTQQSMFIQGLAPGATYFARIVARGPCGESVSRELRADTACGTPAAPMAFPPVVQGSQVTLAWLGNTELSPMYTFRAEIGTQEGASNILVSGPNGGGSSNPSLTVPLAPGRYFARVKRSITGPCGTQTSNPSAELEFVITP